MPEWLPALMGPGGGIIVFVVAGKFGFNFLTSLITKQEKRQIEQDTRLDALHVKILESNGKQVVATTLQTKAIENLSSRLQLFINT